MSRIDKDLIVKNELGLHVRPAGALVKIANQYKSKIMLKKDDDIVDAKSIMGVMMLGAGKGTIIHLTVEGDDAELAAEAIAKLFSSGFSEYLSPKKKSG